jgi:DNA polymerase III sliding clamp (beta) subunit (PCNA family)
MADKINFSIYTKDLLKALNIANQVSPKKSDVELFTYSKIELNSTGLYIFSANNNIFFNAKLKLENMETIDPFVFLVKTDQITAVLAIIKDDLVTINIDLAKSIFQISGEKSRHQIRIKTDGIDNYITPENKKEEIEYSFSLTEEDFSRSVNSCNVSVGNPRNMFETAYLNICFTVKPTEQMINIVSTDRYRITKNVVNTKIGGGEQVDDGENTLDVVANVSKNYLLSPAALRLIRSCVSDGKEIRIEFQKDYAFFYLENNWEIVARYGDGKYSDYDKIIPASFACMFNVDTAEFQNALKQVYWCIQNDPKRALNIEINPEKSNLTLKTINLDAEEAVIEVPITNYEGQMEEWSQLFNADYVKDYVSTIKTGTFLLEANPGKPIVLSPLGEKDKQFYLVGGIK